MSDSRDQTTVFGRRAAHHPAEDAREVAVVGESAVMGDAADRQRPPERGRRASDAAFPQVLADRAAVSTAKCLRRTQWRSSVTTPCTCCAMAVKRK